MRQYYQITIFDEKGFFIKADLEKMLSLGRKYFFVFFPRQSRLEEVSVFLEYVDRFQDIRFCVHDKNVLSEENKYTLGRNLAFYSLINRRIPYIENVSFHMGSLFGFGAAKQKIVLNDLLTYPLTPDKEAERYLLSIYNTDTYMTFIDTGMDWLKAISKLAKEGGFEILIKNLCLDYVLADTDTEKKFREQLFPLEAFGTGLFSLPLPLEKGDFPRYAKELEVIGTECDVHFSLDLEYFRQLMLLSTKYHLENEVETRRWGIELDEVKKDFVSRYGFWAEKGKPVFYEKKLDLYDEISFLKNKVKMAHLSASVGPVFLDRPGLELKDVTTDLLLGIVSEQDRRYLVPGKRQMTSMDGMDDQKKQAQFANEQTQKVWLELFKRQYSEDIILLKEISCERVVQKMKGFSEKSAQTFEMFKVLTELEASEDSLP